MVPTSITGDISLRPTLAPNSGDVVAALRRAADETGADFDYLLQTAMRESSLNPGAQASSSSATGLFQFIEQTWLGTLKRHGAEHGLQAYADAIKVGSNGRYTVADRGLRQEILALRKDASTAALMAGEMTNQVRGDMEAALGRGVSAGELYVAHFLGPKAAIKMIQAAAATPQASAADMFPQAAAANRTIFYGHGGGERSVASVLAALTARHGNAGAGAGDIMLAAVQAPAAVKELPATPESAISSFATFGQGVMVIAPLMAQLLASLDPTPHVAALIGEGEPELRRSDADLI
jgi:hypothetical protein